jgi:hypothetical protein
MTVTKKLIAACAVLAAVACNENPRSEVRNAKELDGTGQTGQTSTRHGPLDTVEGRVDVPPTAALQPASDPPVAMALDAGVDGASNVDAGSVNPLRDASATMDAGASGGVRDATLGIDASR